MALTDTDRRRLLAVTALTVLALPALWWANTSEDSAAPSLAVAGIEVADSPDQQTASTTAPAAPTGAVAPVFLDGPSSAAGAGQSEIAVPARPLIEGFLADATFRSGIRSNTCIVPAIASGSQVTVVNLANNRSITCTSVISPGGADVVLATSAFAQIADVTDAPISVEIRR